MKRFKNILLLSSGSLYIAFLLLQQFFCPRNEVLALGSIAFFFYIFTNAIFLRRWSEPLEQMIEAVTPSQKGDENFLPKIAFQEGEKNAFTPLAAALNALTEKVRKQMERSQKKDKEMEGILESLNEGVIAFDARAKAIFANQVACKILALPHDILIENSLYSPAHPESLVQKCHELVLHALQTSETVTQKWTKQDSHFDLVAAPLVHQEGVILVLQDKTPDYKVLEVGKTFIANASHELRTPITIIRGFDEMLQNDSRLSLQTKIDITNKIVHTCDRFDKLVKSLLTIADLENISPERFRTCNLISLIDNCKHLLLTAYPHVQISISSPLEEVFTLGDPDLLDLAIMNLLENAVKYSPSSPRIHVSIQIKNEQTTVSIQDQGIGIPAPDLPHIFDRFYTVDKARSRKKGGVGLGLSIVKTILEKHQGTVSVASELGKGSEFSLNLPIHTIPKK